MTAKMLSRNLWKSGFWLGIYTGFFLIYLVGPSALTAQSPSGISAQPQSTAPVEENAASSTGAEATLVIQNRTITVFRSRFFGRSPAVRVEGAQRQFREAIASRQAGTVTSRAIPEGMQISIGEEGIFSLTPDDLDKASEETMDEAAASAVNNLTLAYAETLELRDAGRIWKAVGLTVAATILLILSFWLMRRVKRFAHVRLVRSARTRIGDVDIGGFKLLTREQALHFTRWLLNALIWAVGLVLIYLWLAYSLQRFPYTRPWGEALGSYLLTTFGSLLLGAVGALPGLLVVVIILFVTRLLARWVRAFFNAVEAGKVSVDGIYPDTAPATRTVSVLGIWVFGIIVAYPYIPGSDTQVFKAIGVFLGVVVSFSSSGLLSQAMSGLVLMYSRALSRTTT